MVLEGDEFSPFSSHNNPLKTKKRKRIENENNDNEKTTIITKRKEYSLPLLLPPLFFLHPPLLLWG